MEVKIYKHVLEEFIETVRQQYPKKVFGYFLARKEENIASSFYIFEKDDRGHKEVTDKFLKLGKYYENNQNAGFLSSADETFHFEKFLMENDLIKLGVFHVHLRHPPFFSVVDKQLHPSPLLWHLLISLRNVEKPTLAAFEIIDNWFEQREIKIVDDSTSSQNSYTKSTDHFYITNILNVICNSDEGVLSFSEALKYVLELKDSLPIEVFMRLSNYFLDGSDDAKKLYTQWLQNHSVKVNFDFISVADSLEISRTAVTNRQFKQVFPNYSFTFGEEDYPVVNVSWYQAKLFSALTGTSLLSEMIWEKYCDDKIPDDSWEQYNPALMEMAVYSENSNNNLHKVATKKPNNYGLFDMQGNAWEWCDSSNDNSAVTKGGSYLSFPEMCRATVRQVESKDFFCKDITFRVMRRND